MNLSDSLSTDLQDSMESEVIDGCLSMEDFRIWKIILRR